MTQSLAESRSNQSMILLSRLLLVPRDNHFSSSLVMEGLRSTLRKISRQEFDSLLTLAHSNHVVVRTLEIFLDITREAKDDTRAEWAQTALADERARITTALRFLEVICTVFGDEKLDLVAIKSLDHWPDFGSDIDLYTNANSENVSELMKKRFDARVDPPSWGDRLASKWNFLVPGLPEAVEVHVGRLGQTGEQAGIASHLAERSRLVVIGNQAFRVPSVSDQLMISTLQRMYRHFYFRLCDVVDTAALAETYAIDYVNLRALATNAGIWEGVATYLVIVSDYVRRYSGSDLGLPLFVRAAACFSGDDVYYARQFLRVPIMPQAAMLYGSQLAELLRKRDLQNGARLSLLPWLATAALVGQRITGSDKGIW